MSLIHPTAVIEDNTQIGPNCSIGAYAIIKSGTILGENVQVDHHAVIGGLPQVIGFDRAIPSGVIIGANTIIREGVTIHRGSKAGVNTCVGNNCFLMANSHVAHDCIFGNNVIMANGVLPGGHVRIDDYTVIGGNAVMHQNIRIGQGVMIAGRAALNLNIPPFLLVSEHNRVHGLNLIGLKRRGFIASDVAELKACFKAVLGTPGNPKANAEAFGPAENILCKTFLEFFTLNADAVKGSVQYRHITTATEF